MGRVLLGANYYPEAWDLETLDFDIEKMKECGFNVVRIAEFAWWRMEPSEGDYSFDWLHRVVDKMKAAGIGVIMGTPTATPPRWLTKKHPEMRYREHGGRRHCCSSNPEYQRYSAAIVARLAEEFGKDEGVIGWQIDNEIYHSEPGCCCRYCMKDFQNWLYAKYGDADGVNRAWNLNLFSQAYDAIEDIPAPINAWHNPHIRLEWNLSHFDAHLRFVHMQAEIIKQHSTAPVGTDTMPLGGFDYRKMTAPLDVVQYNHYETDLATVCMWMDYMRHFTKRPFWNTETQPCWNGSTRCGHALQDEGFIYMNTWLPFILGGEANLYWLFRTHWAGHELMHGAVLDTSGRYTYANGEIRRANAELLRLTDLPDYRVESDTAILFSSLNWNIKMTQDISEAIGKDNGFTERFYKQLLREGIHPDVIDAGEPLDAYRLLFTPTAYTLEEYGFAERVEEWVKNGGVWVTGPLTDIRTAIGTKYKSAPYGMLEKILSKELVYILPADAGNTVLQNNEGATVLGNAVHELFDADGVEPLITVKEGHSALVGKCVSFIKPVGRGYVVMLGTLPDDAELSRIMKKAARLASVLPYDVDEGIMVTKRVHGDSTLYIAASIGGKAGEYRFSGKYRDILTSEVFEGVAPLSPYAVRVLARI